MNNKGVIEQVTNNVSEVLDYSFDQIIDKNLSQFLNNSNISHEEILGKETTSLRDFKLLTYNDKILRCNLEIIPQHNSLNQISGYLAIIEPIDVKNNFFGNNLKEIRQIFGIIEDQEFVSIALLQDNVFKYVNKNFLKVTGYSREEVRKWGPGEFLKTIHPDYRDFVKEQAQKKQVGDNSANFHYFFKGLKKSGKIYFAEVYSKIIEYQGKSADLVLTLEKTEHNLMEKKLKESEKRYKVLFEKSPYYILIVDKNWKVIDCNSIIRDIIGYSKEEVIGKTLNELELVDISKLGKLNQRTKHLLDGKEIPPIELQVKKKNGDLIWVKSQPALFRLGSKNFIQIYGKDITDIKLTEQKLKEKAISYQNLTHNLPAIVYRVRVDENKTIFLNNKFKEIIGYTVEELKKNKISSIDSLIIDEDKVDVIEAFENSRKKKESFELEYRIHDKEGNIKWLQERGNPILDINENIKFVDGVIFDITERKLAEKNLKKSEKRYRDLFQKSPIGFYEEDFSAVKGYIDALKKKGVSDIVLYLKQNRNEVNKLLSLIKRINLNKAILDLFKASDVEDLNNNSSKIFTSKSFNTFIQQIDCLLRGKKFEGYSEARTLKGDLIVTYVIMERLTKDVDDWSRILFSIRDVTEQKQAEEMLKNSEEKFRTITEQSIIGLNIMQGGRVKYANKAIADMYGYDYSAIKNWSERDFIRILHPQDKSTVLEAIKEQVRSNKKLIQFSCRIITSFGQTKWIEVISKPIFYRTKAATLNMVVDITDQKKAEKELTRLNQIKSDLLKRTSHELKTPLVSIKGFSNLLIEMYKDKLTDDIIKLIDEIKSGVFRLESLIGDILKTAELESETVSFNKSYENLASIIRETVKELEGFIQDRNHEITINLPEELNALVERKNIKEVVGNLLTNAIKYTPPGGQIKVKSQKSEENIKILIQDTGIGLTEEEQSQLFKQFGKIEKYGQGWDIHSEGTGLGLFISKKIIDLHGGSIGVDSEGMNKGCTFYFTIPLYSNFEGEVNH